ncbi:MAG TPA: hypothetical protein DDY16_06330 [Tenacibaculum sp.]|nr:hypothetical protein [Tenacibaculum sp.]
MSVPDGYSLSDYRKKVSDKISAGWDVFKGMSQAAATMIGIGGAINTALRSAGEKPTSPEEILAEYLTWVSKNKTIFIVIDNYQFINHEVRFSLEYIVQKISLNTHFIIVDRTIDTESEITPPLDVVGDFIHEVKLFQFSKETTHELVSLTLNCDENLAQKITEDVFAKTLGLAKDIEYCLKHISLSLNEGKEFDVCGLLTTIHKLPLMHKQYLLIATMLDGGIQKEIANNAIKRVSYGVNEIEMDAIISHLISLEYLKFNSDTGNRLRTGHERISHAMKEIASNEWLDEIRVSLINEFEELLERNYTSENEGYVLHCLIGLQTAIELSKNLHFVSRLIKRQYIDEQFFYLVTLSEEAKDIMPILPDHSIMLILDSMQKTSNFEKGLFLLQYLEERGITSGAEEKALFKYKFLSQSYDYNTAEKVAELLPSELWTTVYKVNLYLSLDKIDVAIRHLEGSMLLRDDSEANAVLQRNSVTLLPPELAFVYLDKAEIFFQGADSKFRVATVETNRGFSFLCIGKYREASRSLSKAVDLMNAIGSREVFQAQFNLGIVYGMEENYLLSEEYLNLAHSLVPNNLLLDKVKIELSQIVFQLISGKIGESSALLSFKELLKKIKGIRLPYLTKTLLHNISVLEERNGNIDDELSQRLASKNKISIYFPVTYKNNLTLIINPSIHWRY